MLRDVAAMPRCCGPEPAGVRAMRIGLTLERFDPHRGGLENWTYQFAQTLAERGHEVHVLAQRFAHDALEHVIPHPLVVLAPASRSPRLPNAPRKASNWTWFTTWARAGAVTSFSRTADPGPRFATASSAPGPPASARSSRPSTNSRPASVSIAH